MPPSYDGSAQSMWFFGNGALPGLWKPAKTGTGTNWDLSAQLQGMGQAMLSLGSFDLAGGAGITMPQQTDNDIAHQNSVIKERLGLSGVITYHVGPSVTLIAQFFHAEHVFWRGQMQMVNFVHAGMNFVW